MRSVALGWAAVCGIVVALAGCTGSEDPAAAGGADSGGGTAAGGGAVPSPGDTPPATGAGGEGSVAPGGAEGGSLVDPIEKAGADAADSIEDVGDSVKDAADRAATELKDAAAGALDDALGAAGADTAGSEKPKWVDDPASFFDPPQPDTPLAVGSAPVREGQDHVAKMMAEAIARGQLMRSVAGATVIRTETGPDGSTIRSENVSGTVSSKTLATWKSPDGLLYVLVTRAD